ncbi:unnamed protein product [Menidia menidia]|uniref:(Atlantic silverside) hypothetical protein n=1 Tax=Menidia menidia TaxID=238744 RepID=A0A8S4AMZ4_9TELE|nr:unnamed protein product [Menidia menidia]
MDNLETPYDEEAEFIDCKACEKSLRGETLYKIHLTSPGHIKREEMLVAQGLAVRKHAIPSFKDISQYLDYLKLDEPIIGLDFLDEIPNPDPQTGPKYMCTLCNQSSPLADMVYHVIGRKHRLKYVEQKRPDLVTWDGLTIRNQGGKVMKAKAELIERQDGRGNPKPLLKRGLEGNLNISSGPQRKQQFRDRSLPLAAQQEVPPLLPQLQEFCRRRSGFGYADSLPLSPEEPDRSRKRERLSRDREDSGDLRRGNYSEEYRGDFRSPDYAPYGGKYAPDPQRSGGLEPQSGPRFGFQEQAPPAQALHQQYYPEDPTPDQTPPYPEPGFYSEEVRRRQDYPPPQQAQPWSLGRDPGRHDGDPEAKRRTLSSPPDGDRSRGNLFNIIKDYNHEMRGPFSKEAFDPPGPSRAGAPSPQRHAQVPNSIANIPEPFRRFLKGNDERRGKRKSRFSDATPEELERTKEMFSDGYGPQNPQTGGNPRAIGTPLRPEFNEAQYMNHYGGSQSSHFTGGYHTGGSESDGVFDMLKNIEIENAEDANFLKSKLSSLLDEFKAKKMEKALLNRQSREGGMSRNYPDFQQDPQPSQLPQYDRGQRQGPIQRGPENLDYNQGNRGGWKQQENRASEQPQQYNYPARGDSRHSSRGRYEDEAPYYPKRFEEPMHRLDYQAPVEDLFASHSSAPPAHMEQMSRMQRDARYNSLDKITSTLLELVGRKQ